MPAQPSINPQQTERLVKELRSLLASKSLGILGAYDEGGIAAAEAVILSLIEERQFLDTLEQRYGVK